ncbi:zinc finger CCCH domain-containing protein 17-like [Macadamia integrifolia]|uniref:zinc finger CCCH domain-containing protein 17-like n=1 Tax=Macadamia integrifolia TaxID=60698 RepID=UPI001C5331D0|nr:zinc finger CCCH domain-containing protein 17-like [Macadamia integrifolia]XP_042480624.1 zinc finger CCCH domain-containing protein 17-like [Macadamia integrifolia]
MTIAVESAARDGNKLSVFNRLGATAAKPLKVCRYWRSGRCNRNPCPFLHRELPPPPSINGMASNRPRKSAPSNTWVRNQGAGAANVTHKTEDKNNGSGLISVSRKMQDKVCPKVPLKTQNNNHGTGLDSVPHKMQDKDCHNVPCKTQNTNHGAGLDSVPGKKQDKVCRYWLAGNCSNGDKCKYLHSWFLSDSFTLLKKLEGHQKGINGVALPSGSDKLYSGSEDQSVRFWDCHTGQCAAVVILGGEIGCMISEGPWLFVGIPNSVKVWNIQTASEFSLSGPVGQVHSLAEGNGILFAGTEDGKILAWKIDAASNCFQPIALLEGHSHAVVSLVVGAGRLHSGAGRLYSASMDHTIRVWDLETLQCTHTLRGHTSAVMSVLCWDDYLLSCSLDKTIKAWAATESGDIEVVHTHNEENGVLTLCGMHDGQEKPVLMCSCDDNTVHIYDLPSFNERGIIFSKEEVRVIQIAPEGLGLFFTGDGTGELRVWKWVDLPLNQQTE